MSDQDFEADPKDPHTIPMVACDYCPVRLVRMAHTVYVGVSTHNHEPLLLGLCVTHVMASGPVLIADGWVPVMLATVQAYRDRWGG